MPARQDIQTGQITEVQDLVPVELPGRNMAPSIEERVDEIENVLKIH